jgi:hypothetical protein
MALSNHMNANLDGKLNQEDDAGSNASGEKKENELVESQFNNNQAQQLDDDDDQEKYKKQMSLFIFSYENPIRALLRDFI